MALHWTYAPFDPDSDLEQGDYLAPTPELRAILKRFHPYFDDDRYLGFLITTQSCDLVRRGSDRNPKATHLNIASVRSLAGTLPRLLEQEIKQICPGVYLDSKKGSAQQFLDRLLDQNEQSQGLFYLHQDANLGLAENAVAFLRVTVALKSQHYAVMLQARRGRLRPEFGAKLGWLLGNLYARAASPDWADQANGKKDKKSLVTACLDEILWVDDRAYHATLQQGPLPSSEGMDFVKEVEQNRPPPVPDQLADIAREVTAQAIKPLAAQLSDQLKHTLEIAHTLTDPKNAQSGDLIAALQKLESLIAELGSSVPNKAGQRFKNHRRLKQALKQ